MSAPQSITIIEDVLSRQGYEFKALELAGKWFMQIAQGGQPLLIMGYAYPLYPFATSSARLIAKHKDIAYEFVRSNGVAVPETVVVKDADLRAATELLQKSRSVIVKPQGGLGSKGLSLDVTGIDELQQAVATARQYDADVLVQRQFYGEEVRFTVIKGKVRAALLRQKPHVKGDGVSTLAQLIQKENEARRNISSTLVPYPQLDAALVDLKVLESDEVVPGGEIRELNKNTMIRGGASVYDIMDEIDPGYIALAEKACQGMGSGLVVADIMIADYTVPPASDNYVFIEFNLAPALSLFYSCRDGKHVEVVEKYLAPMLIEVMEGRS